MEITLENLNTIEVPAELRTAIFSKFESELPVYLQGKEFYVKPKAEYDTELKTANEAAVRTAIGDESAKLYGSIDSLVAVALGETKPDKMPTREWLAQLETDGKLPLSTESIEKVRTALKGESSATKDAVVEGLKKQLEAQQKAQETAVKSAFTKTVNRVVNADLRNAPFQIDAAIKDEAAKATARTESFETVKALFSTFYEAKEDDTTGELYFVKKGTDAALMNVAENRAMTPTEIIRANHSMFLAPAGHTQTGAGSNRQQQQQQGAPGAFTSVAQINKYAIETKGFPAYSKEFNEFVESEAKKAKLI